MSAGLSFGALPAFADLSPNQQAQIMAALQGQGQPANAPQVAPSSLLGQVDPQATGAIPDRGGPPVAMGEHQTQALERAMASPQDRAALGSVPGSPDQLLFDRAGMGGGANPFGGSADPSSQRNVPLPPQRPSEADLLSAPTATGSVSGTNPGAPRGQLVATSAYHPNSPGTDQAAPGSTPTGGYPGGAGEFDPLTGQRLSDQPRSLGTPQGVVSPAGAAAATGASSGLGGGSVLERFRQGVSAGNPDIGNLLFHLGIGIASNRGIGPGVAAGLQSYGASQAGSLKGQLEQIKFMQEQQGQQDTYSHLVNNLKLDPTAARAAMRNPTVLNNLLTQSKPNLATIGGNVYDLNRNGGVPGQANLLGPSGIPLDQEVKKADALASVADAHAKDDIVLQS
ncbi:hypothetical protein MKK63_27070, partial [Methylobacterium sp. J-088]|uniref:hypothetical protein n=1 Tax=Methylobacterium sp. J-088 TaxID=2836664 RepID=UPI001FBBC56D